MGLLTWLVLISVFDIYLSFSHFLFFFFLFNGGGDKGTGCLKYRGRVEKAVD